MPESCTVCGDEVEPGCVSIGCPYPFDDAEMAEARPIMSLPMASETARSEARFITEAAKRVAEQLAMVCEAARDGQRRIRATQHYVEDLDRHGSIDRAAAQEILRHLLRSDERRYWADIGDDDGRD